MLTLRYFGPFSARRDGAEVAFPTRPAARLLALLATEPGHRWRREAVAREIWPEAEWGTESSSLRTALAMIRRTAGTEVVGSDREWVWIDPLTIATDFDRFAVLVRREGLETEEDGRERILGELTEAPLGFLEGWEATWITHLRGEHVRTVARITLELARAKLLLQRGLGAELGDPLRVRTLHTVGMLEFRTADYEAALAGGRAALALDPDPALRNDLRMVRGATLNTQARWDESAAEHEDHLALMAASRATTGRTGCA